MRGTEDCKIKSMVKIEYQTHLCVRSCEELKLMNLSFHMSSFVMYN